MIGREKELTTLKECLSGSESQFIAVYGRRRIGKTMLVREAYAGKFTFLHTGMGGIDDPGEVAGYRVASEIQQEPNRVI